MYQVLVTCYNAQPHIGKCLASIQSQSFADWQCYVLNDLSEDNSLAIAKSSFGNDDRFVFIDNATKKHQLGNYVSCIHGFVDDDVCITVDADDWLPDSNVFDRVHTAYKQGAWITWGSFETIGSTGIVRGMGGPIVDLPSLRQEEWFPSHLRTWKTFLWRKIEDTDLRDPDTGDYFTVAGDMAFMFPMVEMACAKGHYLDSINYFYNNRSDLCNHVLRKKLQVRNDNLIRGKTSYFRKVIM